MLYSYDLSGSWDLSMEQFLNQAVPNVYADTITLPGTTSYAQKGTPNSKRETGFLTDAYAFEGQAWFHKLVTISQKYIGLPCKLVLERTRVTNLWVNGVYVGTQNSLCTPHIYDLTNYIHDTKVEILICVDNKNYPTKGGHLTSPDTQSNWNGITGAMKLEFYPSTYIENVQVYPDFSQHTAKIRFSMIGNKTAKLMGKITCTDSTIPEISFEEMVEQSDEDTCSILVPLGDKVSTWDEYNTNLYSFSYTLQTDSSFTDQGTVTFGIREFTTKGRKFLVNGSETMLRGKHDGLVFPKTGYAPTTVPEWKSVFAIAKDYGINHYRFHTCCPPEAAFVAADQMGIYLEPELPFWGTITTEADENHNAEEQGYLIQLGEKILNTFGNHPSFMSFSLGNELWGNPERISSILQKYKALDTRHLYTQGCNNFQHFPLMVEEDDFFVGVRLSNDRLLRGSYGMCDAPLGHIQTDKPSTMHCYDEVILPQENNHSDHQTPQEIEIQYGTGVKKVKAGESQGLNPEKPIITHEIGQYETYPNFQEIEKYTGPLKARNFEVFRERLAQKGMLHQAEQFYHASGMLAAQCYKEELEAVMRSQEIAGFQLLDLQDFPGQGTALVGMLDAFLDNKGFVTPEEWRMSCSDCVLLAKFPSYIFVTGQPFVAQILLRSTRPNMEENLIINWSLETEQEMFAQGTIEAKRNVESSFSLLGTVFTEMTDKITRPIEVTFRLNLEGTIVKNTYKLWVYPTIAMPSLKESKEVFVTSNLTEAIVQLANGQKVLFLPETMEQSIPGFYCTDFWCYPMFRDICNWMKKPVAVGTMGLTIQNNHPALQNFFSHDYSTPQWYDIVSNSSCAILDETDEHFTPIVQMIDNFDRNHKLGILFEANVLSGKLMVCTAKLPSIAEKPEARWLLKSILDYMHSDEFNPTETLSTKQLRQIF